MATTAKPPVTDKTRPIRSFRDLNVWRKALDLAVEIHRLTGAFSPDVPTDLSQGMRESATALTTQLAQGHTHSYIKDFLRCLDLSLATLSDLETRVLLARVLGYLDRSAGQNLETRIAEVRRMEWGLVNSLRARNGSS